MSVTIFPEGMTDPDERDAWLEARDSRGLATRDGLDAAVMAAVPPDRFHPNTDRVVAEQILARRLYGELPWWRRWRTPAPDGWRTQATGPINP